MLSISFRRRYQHFEIAALFRRSALKINDLEKNLYITHRDLLSSFPTHREGAESSSMWYADICKNLFFLHIKSDMFQKKNAKFNFNLYMVKAVTGHGNWLVWSPFRVTKLGRIYFTFRIHYNFRICIDSQISRKKFKRKE